MCDLLSVNTVEQVQARAEGVDSLPGLVFTYDLETSASDRPRGPMFEVCSLAVAEFIQSTPAGALPDSFASSEVFGPKLPPMLRIVGK
ncbi:hypothetical protein E5198_15770 [Pseudomonas sp. A-1]|uniref:hypothetical protein n=1 Tax=Pseudomonas sp. A-1 TaxID=1821274 RepID=UPI0010A6ABEA|nr:hypothetical protein [Pseudomonas sp. A-1]THG78389.1 hypothetical protein E5198_15770 [Pseudomonas sp. A-1]